MPCDALELTIGDTKFSFGQEHTVQEGEIPQTMVAYAPGHIHGRARHQTQAAIDRFFDRIGDDVGISLVISIDQKPAAGTTGSEPRGVAVSLASRAPAPSDRPRA